MKASYNTGRKITRSYDGNAQKAAANGANNVPALRVIVANQAELIAALIERISALEAKLAV